MPLSQTASVSVFDFGAPVLAADVLKFAVKESEGGKLELLFENPSDVAITVSALVSSDNSTYTATTAADNLSVITNVSVPARATRSFPVLLRRGTDKYFKVTASGGGRMQLQVRGDAVLESQPWTVSNVRYQN